MAGGDDNLVQQAASWFARMRAPDGERDRAAFEAWRVADPRNAAAYRQAEDDWSRAGVLRESPLLDSFRMRPPWWKRLALDRPRVFAPALALAVLIIVLGLWAVSTQGRIPTAAPVFAAKLGEIRMVNLSDGTAVTLDTDSAVTEIFTSTERVVRLERGRARFDVARDPGRSFVVLAGEARITDKGTVFDVRLSGGRVDVALLRGRIEIRSLAPASGGQQAASLVMTEGQRATILPEQPPMPVPGAAKAQDAWVGGMLEVDDTPLSDMLVEVNRYNSRHIVLGDPRLAALHVTGAYRVDAPADIVRNLAALFQLRVRSDRDGNWVLLPADGSR